MLAQPKRLALLAYLASATPRGFHSRDTLLALFWPESDQERARNACARRCITCGVPWATTSSSAAATARWGWTRRSLVRRRRVRRAVAEGRHEDALKLYRGDLLPGFFIEDAPEAERWLEDERARRRSAAVDAAWTLAAGKRRAGSGAPPRSGRSARVRSTRKRRPLRRLLVLLDRAGEPAAGLEAFAEFERRLEAEYGLAPSAETLGWWIGFASRVGGSAPSAVPSPAPPREPRPAATEVTDVQLRTIDAPAVDPSRHRDSGIRRRTPRDHGGCVRRVGGTAGGSRPQAPPSLSRMRTARPGRRWMR